LAVGCKITHKLKHPYVLVVMDEVGGNINMKGDGHIRGEMYLTEVGVIGQQNSSRNNKHFTLCGLTLLNGEPLMCVVILAGIRDNKLVELGINPRVEEVGNVSNDGYSIKNLGKVKQFPGGPECSYHSKKIPCMYTWLPKGSMTSEILKDVAKPLDTLEIFGRSTSISLVLLLYVHVIRLQLPFLQYINYDAHKWAFLIGVPYVTNLW